MENSVSDGGNVMLVQATVIFLPLKKKLKLLLASDLISHKSHTSIALGKADLQQM